MLNTFDLSLTLGVEEYKTKLKEYQSALDKLASQLSIQQRSVTIVMEGWDAAGKSSAIRRITENLDPYEYVVYSINPPKGDDKSHHYLRRFWERLPQTGQIAIFDHSWYGRVLNDRVAQRVTEEEWKRAYREINSFERQQIDFGTILFKLWLHIDQEEQTKRINDRSEDENQSWGLCGEDWQDAEKWGLFAEAVNDMLLKTSPSTAPWTVIESNSKQYAKIKILKTLVDSLSQELKYDPFYKPKRKPGKEKRKKKK
jgi:polyphosphate kinase 2 (PPK2 family)